jgi:hypothetical protein
MSILNILSKTSIKSKIKVKVKFFLQYLNRLLNYNKNKIYFPYSRGLQHPIFFDILKNPPLNYCNLVTNPKIFHFVGYININLLKDKKIIFYEPVDDPLSILWHDKNVYDAKTEMKYINIAKKYYLSNSLKYILVWSEGLKKSFLFFNSKKIMSKVKIIPIGLLPRHQYSKLENKKINFLCIASDYNSKGVFLVLDAWKKITAANIKLTLVCHNIPKKIKIPTNVIVINSPPSFKFKNKRKSIPLS